MRTLELGQCEFFIFVSNLSIFFINAGLAANVVSYQVAGLAQRRTLDAVWCSRHGCMISC